VEPCVDRERVVKSSEWKQPIPEHIVAKVLQSNREAVYRYGRSRGFWRAIKYFLFGLLFGAFALNFVDVREPLNNPRVMA
jgi:hypothetical protein